MTFVKISDYQQRANRNLIGQFQKGLVSKFTDIYAQQIQQAENSAYDIYFYCLLDNAYGAILDLIGVEAGISRPLESPHNTDDYYKTLIRGKIASYVSIGRESELRNIVSILGSEKTWIRDLNYASINIDMSGSEFVELSSIYSIIKECTPPIEIQLVKNTSSKMFGFIGNPLAYGLGEGELGSSYNEYSEV